MNDFALAERPSRSDYAEFYGGYVGEVPDGDVLATLEHEGERALSFFAPCPPSARASPTRRESGRCRKCSRISPTASASSPTARCRFGRGDATGLPGFDQEVWAPQSHADRRRWEDLLDEFRCVRAASLHLFRSFDAEDWRRGGVASGHPITVRALAWIVAGHELHHRRVLVERYGLVPPA